MLLLRLAKLAPVTVIPCLDGVTDALKSVMKNIEVKEDTIKQDLERKSESHDEVGADMCRGNAALDHAYGCATVQDEHSSPGACFPPLRVGSAQAGGVEGVPRLPSIVNTSDTSSFPCITLCIRIRGVQRWQDSA